MMGRSIPESGWKHREEEERGPGRSWVPAVCLVKCQGWIGLIPTGDPDPKVLWDGAKAQRVSDPITPEKLQFCLIF